MECCVAVSFGYCFICLFTIYQAHYCVLRQSQTRGLVSCTFELAGNDSNFLIPLVEVFRGRLQHNIVKMTHKLMSCHSFDIQDVVLYPQLPTHSLPYIDTSLLSTV